MIRSNKKYHLELYSSVKGSVYGDKKQLIVNGHVFFVQGRKKWLPVPDHWFTNMTAAVDKSPSAGGIDIDGVVMEAAAMEGVPGLEMGVVSPKYHSIPMSAYGTRNRCRCRTCCPGWQVLQLAS